jgi:general secretion pathway protein I
MSARDARGFTLIEMVIAFAILGLSLSALYATLQNALSRTRHDARFSEATLFARSLLTRAGTEWPLIDGSTTGKAGGLEYELTELTIKAPPDQPPFTLPTVQVTARVSWPELAGRRSISLSTLKLQTGGAQ